MLNPLITYFNDGITDTSKPFYITLQKLFYGVTKCNAWEKMILEIREVLKTCGKGQEYKEAKKRLPYFIPGGCYSDRSKTGRLLKESNVIQIDIDNIESAVELSRIRKCLVEDPHTLMQFLSPSGKGYKAFFMLEDGHSENTRLSVRGYLRDKYQIEVDPVVLKNRKTACYISYDPAATFNSECDIYRPAEKAAEPLPLRGGFQVLPVLVDANTPDHAAGFCKRIIESEAEAIATAPGGYGSEQLNRSAYSVGRYNAAGLNRSDAESAFKSAFLSRRFSRHDIAEFQRIFNAGFDAGRVKKPKDIPDRPYKRP